MKLKLSLVFAPLCLLAACATEPKREEAPLTRVIVQPPLPSEADRLLAYLAQARKLDARGLAIERELVRNAFYGDKSENNRVRLALLLVSMPSSSNSFSASASAIDDGDLITLLEPLAHNTDTPTVSGPPSRQQAEVRALAMLIYGMAQDRKKLRDQWREAQARVNAMRRDDTKEVEARALRSRVEELERNIASLKAIDRSVNRRSEAQRNESPRAAPPR